MAAVNRRGNTTRRCRKRRRGMRAGVETVDRMREDARLAVVASVVTAGRGSADVMCADLEIMLSPGAGGHVPCYRCDSKRHMSGKFPLEHTNVTQVAAVSSGSHPVVSDEVSVSTDLVQQEVTCSEVAMADTECVYGDNVMPDLCIARPRHQ